MSRTAGSSNVYLDCAILSLTDKAARVYNNGYIQYLDMSISKTPHIGGGNADFIIGNSYSEDQVRDRAREILGFKDDDKAKSGVGQLTTGKDLGLTADFRADGWYLPHDKNAPAIVLETKASDKQFGNTEIEQLNRYCKIAAKKYRKIIGILYNGFEVLVYKNGRQISGEKVLLNKEHYIGLFYENRIDKSKIYRITKRINDLLHYSFGVKNLKQRMIFTACALVAKRYGAMLTAGMSYKVFTTAIIDTLSKSYEKERNQNPKLDLLLEKYAEVKMNITDNQEAIDEFIELVGTIADDINSRDWNGEDVMAIFFNEFNRYMEGKKDGQVFTPDHITSFMCRLLEIGQTDVVLDAACGSGAFLIKAMCNMIKEAGGPDTNRAKHIKQHQLYGVEMDKEIFALACANMLIHKDGKSNLLQADSRSSGNNAVGKWIADKDINKVLMNPPFETKSGCVDIVLNVLNSVKKDTKCAFILPNKKLEKKQVKKHVQRMLNEHRLEKIIKLPNETFPANVSTSIFLFTAHQPQNGKKVFTCSIDNDGLVTIKNQGRQDIDNKWPEIEDYWMSVIDEGIQDKSVKWITPSCKNLSYPTDYKSLELRESNFAKTVLDFLMYKMDIDVSELKERFVDIMFNGAASCNGSPDTLSEEPQLREIKDWKTFPITELFKPFLASGDNQAKKLRDGDIPLISAGKMNNGVTKLIDCGAHGTKLYKDGMFTIDMFGYAFYQDKPFYAVSHNRVCILECKAGIPINLEIGLFVATVLTATYHPMSSYEDPCKKEVLLNGSISLPVDDNGKPDWKYMEAYIKRLWKWQSAKLETIKKVTALI